MELQHIKEQQCPHCGRGIRSQKQSNKHTNGHWNEECTFECGHEIRFSPNFMQSTVVRMCRKNPSEAEKLANRDATLKELNALITDANCDEQFKAQLKSQFQYISSY